MKIFMLEEGKNCRLSKHLSGDGETIKGINEGNTVIDTAGLFKILMHVYFDTIEQWVSSIMVPYLAATELKCMLIKIVSQESSKALFSLSQPGAYGAGLVYFHSVRSASCLQSMRLAMCHLKFDQSNA